MQGTWRASILGVIYLDEDQYACILVVLLVLPNTVGFEGLVPRHQLGLVRWAKTVEMAATMS